MTEGTGTQDPGADSAAVLKHGGSTGFSESPRPETDPSPPFSRFQPWEPSRENSIRTKIEGIIRSFSEHLLSAYCVPERVLRTENSAVKKTERKTETINSGPTAHICSQDPTPFPAPSEPGAEAGEKMKGRQGPWQVGGKEGPRALPGALKRTGLSRASR